MTQASDAKTLDPVILALTQNRLDHISHQMGWVMVRTARSPIFSQAHDFSCFIAGPTGEVVSQADGIPIHTGSGGFGVRAILRDFGDELAEGDVYLHTGLVVNEASKIAAKLPEDAAEVLMWAALCHDLGKAETTEVDSSGRVRSPGHDVASARLAQKWLESLKIGSRLTSRVEALCRHHLAPVIFVKDGG